MDVDVEREREREAGSKGPLVGVGGGGKVGGRVGRTKAALSSGGTRKQRRRPSSPPPARVSSPPREREARRRESIREISPRSGSARYAESPPDSEFRGTQFFPCLWNIRSFTLAYLAHGRIAHVDVSEEEEEERNPRYDSTSFIAHRVACALRENSCYPNVSASLYPAGLYACDTKIFQRTGEKLGDSRVREGKEEGGREGKLSGSWYVAGF